MRIFTEEGKSMIRVAKAFIWFVAALKFNSLLAQPSLSAAVSTPLSGWQKITVQEKGRPNLDVYTALSGSGRKPVLVMLQGSRCGPLFRLEAGKVKTPLFVYQPSFFSAKGLHVVAFEKRGIRSFEPIPKEVEGQDSRLRCSETYGGLDKATRVEDVALALNALRRLPWFGSLLILGHSEGADVAAGVARYLENTSPPLAPHGMALISGASPSTLFDRIVEARKQGDKKALHETFDDALFLTSGKADGKFGGMPVSKALSYTIKSTPLDDITFSNAHLFVANGARDSKASVEGADLLVLETLRKQPSRAVRYLSYAKLDHDLVDEKGNDSSADVISDFIAWALSSNPGREFNTESMKAQ